MSRPGWYRGPLFWTGVLLLSQSAPLPSPVRDAATLGWASGFHIVFPIWHLIFTPFCSLADYITVLSLHQMEILVAYVLVLSFAWGGPRKGALILTVFIAFLAWGALIPRPMARLVAEDPESLLIDFHSHTSFSHDGRPSFTPPMNERWHARQGYEAGFITDHNQVQAADLAEADSAAHWKETGYRSLKGEEVSLFRTHLVVLGNEERIDNHPFDNDFDKVRQFLAYAHARHLPVVASLPEYWLYHWGPGVEEMVQWGMDGFEIINSAPKALDFPIADRLKVVAICRGQNLFMTGISDNHGYGYATAAWNAMRVSGWRDLDPMRLQAAVLEELRRDRFNAVTVLERSSFLPQKTWQLVLSPLAHAWYYWRSLSPAQAASWSGWIWVVSGLAALA